RGDSGIGRRTTRLAHPPGVAGSAGGARAPPRPRGWIGVQPAESPRASSHPGASSRGAGGVAVKRVGLLLLLIPLSLVIGRWAGRVTCRPAELWDVLIHPCAA